MAKPLIFKFAESELAFSMSKVDRSRLYGYKELEVLDEKGGKCELATLASDGQTMIGKGGTGLATLTADGHWTDKSQLKPVDLDGKEMQPVPSSYSAPIPLAETATVDEYLQHNIRLVYQLTSEGDVAPLRQPLAEGKIFKFPYSYRGGLDADAGFLLQGEDGNIFFVVGNPTKVEFTGLAQVSGMEEENEAEEADMMDFDMI
jgi:hypothetical protein